MIVVNALIVKNRITAVYVCIDYHYQLYKVEWSNGIKDIDDLTKELTVINTRFQWIPFE